VGLQQYYGFMQAMEVIYPDCGYRIEAEELFGEE